MRIVYMGTPDIAAGILEALVNSRHEVVGVVTQPDKPNARGNEIVFSAVKRKALEHNIEVFQPAKASAPEFVEKLEILNPDIIVVAAYGQLLKTNVLELPKYGCINVHASLLPKYRGASPIQWSIINGDEETGVTIMHMAAGLDTGDMILQKKIKLDGTETAGSLYDTLEALSGPVLLEALDQIEAGTATRTPQDDSKSCYVSVLNKAMGKLSFDKPAVEIERLIRGLIPWPGAYMYLKNGKMLKIWKCNVADSESEQLVYTKLVENNTKALESGIAEEADNMSGEDISPYGQVVIIGERLFIPTIEGVLEIFELQLEGKKRMNTADFLRGSAKLLQ